MSGWSNSGARTGLGLFGGYNEGHFGVLGVLCVVIWGLLWGYCVVIVGLLCGYCGF